MNRGDLVMLKGKKGQPVQVEVIADYRQEKPPFPAIRIKRGENGNEYIVRPDEIFTEEELRAYEQIKESKLKRGTAKPYSGSVPF